MIPDYDDVIHDLELRTDLARPMSGWRPGPAALENAPRLVPTGLVWTPFARPWTVSLVGAVLDANGQPTGRQRIGSFLIAADAAQGKWVRTWKRFYRLDTAHSGGRHSGGAPSGSSSSVMNVSDGDET